MKKPWITVVIAAALSFALGYVAGGRPSKTDDSNSASAAPVQRLDQESPAEFPADGTQAERPREFQRSDSTSAERNLEMTVGALQPDTLRASGPVRQQTLIRRAIVKKLRGRLAAFFVIQGIEAAEADRIVEALTDLQLNAENQPAYDRIFDALRSKDSSEAQKGVAEQELAMLAAEKDSRRREVLGNHYDAYVEYERSADQRVVLNTFEAQLPSPLNSSTRGELLQILVDETPTDSSITMHRRSPRPRTAEVVPVLKKQIEALRSRNARVQIRAKNYLTPEEFEVLVQSLTSEVERKKAILTIIELSPELPD